MADNPLVGRGVDKRTVLFLHNKVLYPDQKVIYIAKGKVIGVYKVEKGVICVTNRTITFYQPKKKKAYDYNLTKVTNFSYRRGFLSSLVEIHMDSLESEEKMVRSIIIQRVPKGKEEQVINLLRKTVEERKRFEIKQKSRGLIRYGFSFERWGSKEEVKQWLERYMISRGFVKINEKWMTEQEYFDYQQRQKGLYKYIESEVEKWGTIDKILSRLSPSQFEDFIGLLFKSMGYEVIDLPYVGDYGADLVAKRNGETIVVQVKKYGSGHRVGAPEVQKTLGSIWKYNANKAILVTTSTFTAKAYDQAAGAPIELWDRKKLKKMLEQHLPTNLIEEKPVPNYLFMQLEKILKSIRSRTISYADSQTAIRMEFQVKIKEDKGKFGIKHKTLQIYISGPIEYVSFLEKAVKDHIQTIPIELRSHIIKWLNDNLRYELEYVHKQHPNLIKN